ncbi:MAG: S9 family peptidase [Clostridia bacterium]|nr:S9 family peptidase [Clostridia bacterium]
MPAKRKPIAMEDIALYQIPSNLHYSPDGKYLAFEVTRMDLEKNEYHTDVYIAKGEKARRVTWSIDANIVLWDDPETLILRRALPDAAPGITELFRLSMAGGEAQPWLTLPFGLRKMEKLTEGYIATGGIRAGDPDAYLDSPEKRKEKAEAEKAEEDYHVVDEVPYWFNGAGYVNGRRTALFLIREKEGKAVCKRLTAPAFSVDSFCVEGDTVYYAGAAKQGLESLYNQLYAWNAATGKGETLWRKSGLSFGGLFTLNGKLYAQVSDMKAYGVNQTPDICAVSKNSVRKAYVPPVSLYSSVLGDTAEGHGGDYAGEGEYLTLATVEAHNAIFALTPGADGGLACRTLWEQEGLTCTMTACSEKIAVVYQGWDHVAEVFEMNRDGSGMTQITHLNEEALKDRYVAAPQRLDYTSCGLDLRGWVLLPQDYSPRKKYPAVLDVHGGPRCAYGETFFHEMQLWVSRGFVVFFTNIKGSDGRGDAFADIRGDYGGTDYQNLMDFTDAVLKAYPNIDPARLCETGGSYGGFMTNWIVGHTDRFCCAASQRSIANWVSMSFISDIGGFFGPDQCGTRGLFGDKNTEALWAHSPLKYAGNAKTPTLFIHSEEDYRCPLPEGMQMMQALVQNGVETRMVIFKGENHELSRSGKPKHRVRRLKEITEWFEKHAKA